MNKSNLGLYVPSFLTLNKKIQKLNDVPMDFSKLVSIEYNKKQKSYHIVYEIQKALEDFSSTGRVVYEKNPIEYSLILIPDQKKPFLIKNFVEKKKEFNKIISDDSGGGMYSYFLKGE